MKAVAHIGLTVTDLDRSVLFYKDVLKLDYVGEMTMQGSETDLLFGDDDLTVRIAYLKAKQGGPEIELIEFVDKAIAKDKASLFKTSISELCFEVDDIEAWYAHLQKHHVEILSKPQLFDSTEYGFGKSKALYFKDPDGIILELIQTVD